MKKQFMALGLTGLIGLGGFGLLTNKSFADTSNKVKMSVEEIAKGLKDGTIIKDTVKGDNKNGDKKEGTDKYEINTNEYEITTEDNEDANTKKGAGEHEITPDNEKTYDKASNKLSPDEIDKGVKEGTIIKDKVEK
ncbi:hypothetical protein IR152_15140 [Clostridioides sp. ES-S-0108-01]|uniref:hypothetical protein n=1 Tax=Clostridioides sp. ES-S-0108-01 TaxID=2770773 RepID=UPI001D0C0522|nr:hypothetical protein [Clostridioides sp. ES-S-0108-01]UDN51586.1 hypothetical protein JJC16_02530 [Clostridioides sp. ES-S-0107-01]